MPQPNLTDWEERALPRWWIDPDTGERIGGTLTPVRVKDIWTLANLEDEIANNSNKHFTVPAGQEWQILWVYVSYVSAANAGNRQLEVQWRNATDVVIGAVVAGAVQAASLTRRYMFAPALADLVGFRDTDYLMTPLPPTLFLSAGEDLRVWTNAVFDPTDDMSVYIKYAYRTA